MKLTSRLLYYSCQQVNKQKKGGLKGRGGVSSIHREEMAVFGIATLSTQRGVKESRLKGDAVCAVYDRKMQVAIANGTIINYLNTTLMNYNVFAFYKF
jgi:hypothetical protein